MLIRDAIIQTAEMERMQLIFEFAFFHESVLSEIGIIDMECRSSVSI